MNFVFCVFVMFMMRFLEFIFFVVILGGYLSRLLIGGRGIGGVIFSGDTGGMDACFIYSVYFIYSVRCLFR